jgi:SNF2 family DNA or RNA helicase/ubiquinone/menaquinone biosynthesis C-methylase UbiE
MAPRQETEVIIDAPHHEELAVIGNDSQEGKDSPLDYPVATIKPTLQPGMEPSPAPEGWLTNNALTSELSRSQPTIQTAANGYAESNPEWFQTFADANGVPRVFYSPELVAAITEEVGTIQDTPEGWTPLSKLPGSVGKDRSTIVRIAEGYREEHPEWFLNIATKESNGKVAAHYSPELIDQIKSEILEPAPEGWVTIGGLAKAMGKDWGTAKKAVEEARELHPEEFGTFAGKGSSASEYISPALAATISERLTPLPAAPEGWMRRNELAQYLQKSGPTIKAWSLPFVKNNPDWAQKFGTAKGQMAEYYSPELVERLLREYGIRNPAPDGWETINDVCKDTGLTPIQVERIAEQHKEEHPEWFGLLAARNGNLAHHYSAELVQVIREEAERQLNIPEGWVHHSDLADEIGVSSTTLMKSASAFREEHPEWFSSFIAQKARRARPVDYYHPDLANLLRERYAVFATSAPEDWISIHSLHEILGKSYGTVKKFTDQYVEEHPDWFSKYRTDKNSPTISIFLHPELVELTRAHFSQFEQAPEGWIPNRTLAKALHTGQSTVHKLAEPYSGTNPDWFKKYVSENGQIALHYSPELAAAIESELMAHRDERNSLKSSEREKLALEEDITRFISSIGEGDNLESQEFQTLLQMFGSERAVDILFQYRPEYQKVSLPFAKRVIGDYLGEFLVVRGDLQLDKLEVGVQYLSDPNLREGLREVIKSDCLRSYNQLRRGGMVENDLSTLLNYIAEMRRKTENYSTPELAEVLDEVEEYYKALFEVVQIPDNVVDELEPGRLFPDINQRINILELMGKQKMLIADEMGVGKSASAILSKESLGVKQALVVVPSNVIEVWQKYLSDHKNGDGSAKGYFKEGQAPRVLTISNGLDSLNGRDLSEFDYVLISQERLNDDYMAFLENLDYDMLIVDEAHKLKNITSGKRADNLVKLAEKIEGDDQYLALLSGTPVPNHVGDIAMILKLLYPEKFEGIANKDLTRQILEGDVLDLRSLLVPRMQMKSLAESIEMPTLHEELHTIQMSDEERNAYDILLEEDELTASQKLQILRQFALNPQIFEVTPGFQSSKLEAVSESLKGTFADKNKVVMFVNGYIDGVIRGENTIFEGLELPEGVEVHVIDGKVPKAQRLEIQKLLQEQSDRKMLLAVSGQTADVGVDFSGAEELYFYNEPWTEYDKRQQQGRVYRPGLRHDLVSHTFYVEGSVEEGIHKYIEYKYTAVEKLLRGIPLSELERELLRDDEKQVDPNLEVNPTLAEHYLSSWHRMLKIYSYVKGIGEEDFVKFLGKYGREYAECYTDLGSRSYQANVGRLAGTTIDKLAKSRKQDPQFVRILDVASGPEMLKRHIGEDYQDQVVSVDINPHHFEQVDEKRRVGSFLDLPVADSTIDYANLSLALHYTKLSLRQGVYEPIKVFQELNRVLVNEGVAVINLMHNNDLKDPELFAQAIEKVGFKVVEGLSGEVSSANNFKSRMLVLQKVSSCTQDTATLVQQMGTPLLHGFKLAKTDVKLKDSRKIVTNFVLNGAKKIRARMNGLDQSVLNEEQATLSAMKSLRRKYGSIQKIPKDIIYQSGLARAFTGKTYVLFKSLETGNGAVIAR